MSSNVDVVHVVTSGKSPMSNGSVVIVAKASKNCATLPHLCNRQFPIHTHPITVAFASLMHPSVKSRILRPPGAVVCQLHFHRSLCGFIRTTALLQNAYNSSMTSASQVPLHLQSIVQHLLRKIRKSHRHMVARRKWHAVWVTAGACAFIAIANTACIVLSIVDVIADATIINFSGTAHSHGASSVQTRTIVDGGSIVVARIAVSTTSARISHRTSNHRRWLHNRRCHRRCHPYPNLLQYRRTAALIEVTREPSSMVAAPRSCML